MAAFVALLFSFAFMAQAQYSYTTNTDGTATITGYTGTSNVMVIPSSIDGFPVTSIGDWAFFDPNGGSDFSGGGGPISVTIPGSVTTIGTNAFLFCINLVSVTMSNGISNIEDGAFDFCKKLESIMIPNTVTNIGGDAFGDCGLTNVFIPSSVTKLGDGVFAECPNLTNVTVDTLNSSYASVDSVVFDKSLTTLFEYPANSTNNYTIPNGVTRIEPFAFNCCLLANVTIANSVTNIGDYAFSVCSNLTELTIPSNVLSIGDNCFSLCHALTNITVDSGNSNYADLAGVLFNKELTTLIAYPTARSGDYVIPSGVVRVEGYAFIETSLGNVTIPAETVEIGDYSFYGCEQMTKVTILGNPTVLGDWAFGQCFNLASIYFKGNAPTVPVDLYYGSSSFYNDLGTVYYLPAAAGWTNTLGGLPTAVWLPKVESDSASFGVTTNQFGFNVAWTSGQTVRVDACTNLANPVWLPLQTNTITTDSFFFSDPLWTNYPSRFYRLCSP